MPLADSDIPLDRPNEKLVFSEAVNHPGGDATDVKFQVGDWSVMPSIGLFWLCS